MSIVLAIIEAVIIIGFYALGYLFGWEARGDVEFQRRCDEWDREHGRGVS